MSGMKFKLSLPGFIKGAFNFFSFGRVLGVDIGTVSIKCVEVSRDGEDVVLENYALLESKDYLNRGNAAIQTSSLKLVPGDVARLLQVALQEMKPKAKKVIASIPHFSAFVVPVEMPLISPAETAKSIPFIAKQYIPLPVEGVKLDWAKVQEFDNAKGQRFQRILLSAIPNELIKKYKAIFHAVGLTLSALEVESHALVRALTLPNDPPAMLIDVGGETATVAIADAGELKYTSQTDYGGAAFTHALSLSLDISAMRAEELKRRRGLLGTEGESELSTSLLPFLDVIIQECERTRGAYERLYGKSVTRAVLVGGSANLPGIRTYFKEQIALEFAAPNAFARLRYPTALEPAVKELNNDLSLAVGLTFHLYGPRVSQNTNQ